MVVDKVFVIYVLVFYCAKIKYTVFSILMRIRKRFDGYACHCNHKTTQQQALKNDF